MRTLAALLALAMLAGCTGPAAPVGSEPDGSGPPATGSPEPIDIREEFDLLQGMEWQLAWNVTQPVSGHVRVTLTGAEPTELHGVSQVCRRFLATEQWDSGERRFSQSQCSSGIQFGSNSVNAEMLVDHDYSGVQWAEYSLELRSEPQVGRVVVEIVAEY